MSQGLTVACDTARNGKRVSAYDQNRLPGIGVGAPAISVAETDDASEVTAELPGVDEKDIDVEPQRQLSWSFQREKVESAKDEKTGMSRRGVTAHLSIDVVAFRAEEEPSKLISTKGCCISRSRNPLKPVKTTRKLDIKPGAPPSPALHRSSRRAEQGRLVLDGRRKALETRMVSRFWSPDLSFTFSMQ